MSLTTIAEVELTTVENDTANEEVDIIVNTTEKVEVFTVIYNN